MIDQGVAYTLLNHQRQFGVMMDYKTTIRRILQSNTQMSQPADIFYKVFLVFFNLRHTTYGHTTWRTHTYVGLAEVVENTHVVIFQQFQPPLLSEV